jgi:Fur family transcriptional regulator, ferric uptake regulator
MERATRQRSLIRTVLDQARRPLAPQEVLEAARADLPTIGLATVYRNLKLMTTAGEIEMVMLAGEVPRYEPAATTHHHHFQCDACHRVFDVTGCPGDLAALAPPGFSVERHAITLYGCCPECGPRKSGKRRAKAAHTHG